MKILIEIQKTHWKEKEEEKKIEIYAKKKEILEKQKKDREE